MSTLIDLAERSHSRVVEITAYALERRSCATLPVPGAAARRYADLTEQMCRLHSMLAATTPAAESELYDLAPSATPEMRRRVILPLRRDVHNGRTPSDVVARAALVIDLPAVTTWLSTMGRLSNQRAELDDCRAEALADSRRALARMCVEEAVQRACALTSSELLHAVTKYAASTGDVDRKSAKSEATVLRHVLRAATKTVPLGWFSRAGWVVATGTEVLGEDVALSRPDLGSLYEVIAEVIAGLPMERRPLRVCPGTYREEHRLWWSRRRGATTSGRELVAVPLAAAPLTIIELVTAAKPGAASAETIARHIGRPLDQTTHAVSRLIDAGILLFDDVVDPQSTDPLGEAASWAAQVGRADLTSSLVDVADATRAWSQTQAARRPARLAELRARWQQLLPSDVADRELLREDVTTRSVRHEPALADMSELAELTPLWLTFDWFTLFRRAQRHQFVEAYGEGGSCASVASYSRLYAELWRPHGIYDISAMRNDPIVKQILSLQARLRALVGGADSLDELVLDKAALSMLADDLPPLSRPVSFSVFLQPGADGITINQVYGGWGRFSSRFLHGLAPQASEQVRSTINRHLGPHAAQIRPVQNFSANLHPLIVDHEIADRAGRGTIAFDDLGIVHDTATDSIRIRHSRTGQYLDVLYLGFLVPMALPAHLVPLVNDLGSGLIDLAPLVPARSIVTDVGPIITRPRLRYRNTVLARRSWALDASQVAQLQRALAEAGDAPENVIAALRGQSGLPRRVFLGANAIGSTHDMTGRASTAAQPSGLDAFVSRMGRPRSQYVDFADALHVRQLGKLLARYASGGACLEEALPVPAPGQPARELVVETYRAAWES